MGLISRVSSRTYRRKNFLKTNMKTVNAVFDVDISEFGDNVKLVVKGQKITVSGPRGTLNRDFSHLKVEVKKTGTQSCKFTKWWSTKRNRCFENRSFSCQKHGYRRYIWFPLQNAY